jgi:TM2 domain-containing membrane protein YozV
MEKMKRKKNQVRKVNWVLCLVMSVVFGSLGVDRYLMGKVGTGILKLITLGGLGVWWLVDVILIATKYEYKDVKWVD